MVPDVVGIVESIYLVQDDTSAWIGRILERLAPWIGDGLGLFGFEYLVSPTLQVYPGAFSSFDCPPEILQDLPAAATRHERGVVRSAYVDSDVMIASAIAGWRTSEGRAYAVRRGVFDVWAIMGRNPGNHGCGLFVNRQREALPSASERELFVRLAAHLAAAHRLRERMRFADAVERAEAIISSDGKLQHAVGDAKRRTSREALLAAAASVDHARAKLRKKDPRRALDTWKALVSARWTLVEQFERDGRRYILAQENQPDSSTATELSPRERQVLANVALGRSNKEIAYVLGLAHSTVRVLLARSARKLGASSRTELLERFNGLRDSGAVPGAAYKSSRKHK